MHVVYVYSKVKKETLHQLKLNVDEKMTLEVQCCNILLCLVAELGAGTVHQNQDRGGNHQVYEFCY
jgi:hypothetical protein